MIDVEGLLRLLYREKEASKQEVYSIAEKDVADITTVGDVDRGNHLYLVSSTLPLERGDLVGMVYREGPEEELVNLGVVVDVEFDDIPTYLVEPTALLNLNGSYQIFRSENMVGYDLQIRLLTNYLEGRIGALESLAFNVVFGNGVPQVERKVRRVVEADLDEFQKEAVEEALSLDTGELLLIVGPPGTGKTRVITTIAKELASEGKRVLITSHTNRAVDTAIERLPVGMAVRVGAPEKVSRALKEHLLDTKVYQTKFGKALKRIEEEIREVKERRLTHRLRALYDRWDNLYSLASDEVLEKHLVVGATLIKSHLSPLQDETFDVVLIDEAGQATIPLALLGMVKAKKYVVVGDHRQLLPVLKTVGNTERYSAFVYLKEKYPHRVRWLKKHYRSNPKIASLTRMFYEERIIPDRSCNRIRLELSGNVPTFLRPEFPVVFVDVAGSDEQVGGSRRNVSEAKVCVAAAKLLKRVGVPEREIAIISPYRAQVELIGRMLRRNGLSNVEVGTVDTFQGRESDVVMYSVTATDNLRFASIPNRLNVAFSRARKKLVVVGNAKAVLRNKSKLTTYLNWCLRDGTCFRVGEGTLPHTLSPRGWR